MLLDHWEVTNVIEMVVGEKDGWEVHKVGKVVTREWRKAKSAELEFAFVSAFRDNSKFWTQYHGSVAPLAMFSPNTFAPWKRRSW